MAVVMEERSVNVTIHKASFNSLLQIYVFHFVSILWDRYLTRKFRCLCQGARTSRCYAMNLLEDCSSRLRETNLHLVWSLYVKSTPWCLLSYRFWQRITAQPVNLKEALTRLFRSCRISINMNRISVGTQKQYFWMFSKDSEGNFIRDVITDLLAKIGDRPRIALLE